MRLLLVEDDRDLARAVETALVADGYSVDAVATGEAALFLAKQGVHDAIILDLGLPDDDGLSVLAKIRRHQQALPVLILTARGSVDDRIQGLNAGADDYLPKPFDIPELVARLRAITRRASGRSDSTLTIGNVMMDLGSHRVTVDDQVVDIAGREYSVLQTLMSHQGRLLTREQLESSLYAWGEDISSNAIEVYIHGLRKKLGKAFIKTVRGIGYGVGLE